MLMSCGRTEMRVSRITRIALIMIINRRIRTKRNAFENLVIDALEAIMPASKSKRE